MKQTDCIIGQINMNHCWTTPFFTLPGLEPPQDLFAVAWAKDIIKQSTGEDTGEVTGEVKETTSKNNPTTKLMSRPALMP
jgi:hypothetical protein